MNTPKLLRAAAIAIPLFSFTAQAQSYSELVERGAAFDQRFEAGQALAIYQKAEAIEPRNAELMVRIARQYRHLMTDATASNDKLAFGRQAVAYSQRAADYAPASPEAQIDLGISYGKMLELLGGGAKVDASRAIKQSIDRTLAIDPRDSTAWHILGRWQYGMAELSGVKRAVAQLAYGGLPDSTFEEAARSFQTSVQIDPSRLFNYIELGRTYAQLARNDDARRSIEKGLAMPNVEKDDPATKQRGREALKTLR